MEEIPRQRASLNAEDLGASSAPISFNRIYELEEDNIIGEGAYGSVYKTHHVHCPEHELAVKVTERGCKRDEDDVLKEVEFLRRLRDVPYVVQIVDFYVEAKHMYNVQELAEGGDVLDRLTERGRYTERDARLLAENLLSALDCIHRNGVVHRDLKLENLLLKNADDDHDILLCDFGCAKTQPDESSSTDEFLMYTMVGTDAYMAPEVVQGEGYGKQAEFWSAGCIIYCLMAGYLPFGESGEPDLMPRIVDCDFDFEDTCWGDVTADAQDLIGNLFKTDSNERWTAQKALESNWFASSSTAATTDARTSDASDDELKKPDYDECSLTQSTSSSHSLEEEITPTVSTDNDLNNNDANQNTEEDRLNDEPMHEIPEHIQCRDDADANHSTKGIIRFQAMVRGFLARTNYKIQSLENDLIEIEQKRKQQLRQIQKETQPTLKKLKQEHEQKRQKQQQWDYVFPVMNRAIDRSFEIIEEWKQKRDLLTKCYNAALKNKQIVRQQQDHLLKSTRAKEKQVGKLQIEIDDIKSRNERLSKTSTILKDAAHMLTKELNQLQQQKPRRRSGKKCFS